MWLFLSVASENMVFFVQVLGWGIWGITLGRGVEVAITRAVHGAHMLASLTSCCVPPIQAPAYHHPYMCLWTVSSIFSSVLVPLARGSVVPSVRPSAVGMAPLLTPLCVPQCECPAVYPSVLMDVWAFLTCWGHSVRILAVTQQDLEWEEDLQVSGASW